MLQGGENEPVVLIDPRPSGETVISVGEDAVTVPATGGIELDVPARIPRVVVAVMTREPLSSRPQLRERYAAERVKAEGLISADPRPNRVRARYSEMTDHGLFALVETARAHGVVVELERS